MESLDPHKDWLEQKVNHLSNTLIAKEQRLLQLEQELGFERKLNSRLHSDISDALLREKAFKAELKDLRDLLRRPYSPLAGETR